MRNATLFVLWCLEILSTSALATDRTVGPPGSGAAFTTLQAAVDAATPGDRVIVLAGNYNGTLFVNKSIEIIGAGSTVTSLRSYAAFFPGQIPPPVRIADLPAGSRVRVAGLTFATIGLMSTPITHLMQVDHCAGRVELSDLMLLGASLPPLPPGTVGGILYVRDCAQVVASGVHAGGSLYVYPLATPGGASPAHGLAGMLIERSSFWLMDGSADGNATRQPSTGFGGDGGAGLAAIDSSVQIGRSVVRGAQSGGLQNAVPGIGGVGLDAVGGHILIHGASGNSVIGATAYEQSPAGWVGLGSSGAAIRLDATSSLTYAADVALVPGGGTASIPAAPQMVVAPGSTVLALGQRLPTTSITPPFALPGTTLTVVNSGQPGLDHIRAVTLQTAPAFTFGGVLGTLLVDLPTVVFWHIEPLGPSGVQTTLVQVPIDPSLGGIQVVEQAAQVLATGVAISPPVLITLGF